MHKDEQAQNKTLNILNKVAVVLLVIVIFPLPYELYKIIDFFIFIISAYFTYIINMRSHEKSIFSFLFPLLTLMFFPGLARMTRTTWIILDFVSIATYVKFSMYLKKELTK